MKWKKEETRKVKDFNVEPAKLNKEDDNDEDKIE